jgi:hypothetical protein
MNESMSHHTDWLQTRTPTSSFYRTTAIRTAFRFKDYVFAFTDKWSVMRVGCTHGSADFALRIFVWRTIFAKRITPAKREDGVHMFSKSVLCYPAYLIDFCINCPRYTAAVAKLTATHGTAKQLSSYLVTKQKLQIPTKPVLCLLITLHTTRFHRNWTKLDKQLYVAYIYIKI